MYAELHDAAKYFRVGQIAGTHALKGEVRVFPMTDDPARFTKDLTLFLEDVRGTVRELVVERSRQNGKFVLVKFRGLDSINDVERFRGGTLYVDRRDAIPLKEGEYFVADLIGLAVYDEDGAPVGELTDVIETGANDVYAVRLADEADVEQTSAGRTDSAQPDTALVEVSGGPDGASAGMTAGATGTTATAGSRKKSGSVKKRHAATRKPREVLLPAIPDCIREIDLENRRMTVHLMDGLL